MAYSITWNAAFEALPAGTDNLSDGALRIRNLKVATEERMQKDHYWDPAGTDADHGEHVKVTLRTGSDPTAVADKGFLYAKDVATKAECFYLDEDNNKVQLTSGGAVKVPATYSTLAATLATVYPIGCIYTSTVSTNPNTVFGFGTWAAFGSGKCLVGLDAGQTEFDTVEETGGAKTVAHTHDTVIPGDESWPQSGGNTPGYLGVLVNGYVYDMTGRTLTSGAASDTNNLQPYIVVYFFKRTA